MKQIERQRIELFEHLMRMDHSHLPTSVYHKIRSVYRARGRASKRLIDSIKDNFNKHKSNAVETTHLALEQKLKPPPLPTNRFFRQVYTGIIIIDADHYNIQSIIRVCIASIILVLSGQRQRQGQRQRKIRIRLSFARKLPRAKWSERFERKISKLKE